MNRYWAISKSFRLPVRMLGTRKLLQHIPAQKAPSHHTPSSRLLHCTPTLRANCDWGRPCDCSECTTAATSKICDVCRKEPTVYLDSNHGSDRKGIPYIGFTNYCEKCWKKHELFQEEIQLLKNLKSAKRREEMEKMLLEVRKVQECEMVPIAYAVDKIDKQSRRSHSAKVKMLKGELAEDLQAVKIKNRWKCNKNKVDMMDFGIFLRGRHADLDWD